jgi:plasmid segregation protein ParM
MKEMEMKAMQPVFVGVDDGHYAIKVVDESGRQFSIPSRAAAGKHLLSVTGVGEDASAMYLTEEGNAYTVSEHLTDPEPTMSASYPVSELNRVLVQHALSSAGFGGKDVSICTGLPVNYFYRLDGQRNMSLIDGKINNLMRKVTNLSEVEVARIRKHVVTTEAVAAYVDQMVDMEGDATDFYDVAQSHTIGVVDIGGKTTDCAVIRPGGVSVDMRRSGSDDIGILHLEAMLSGRLRGHFNMDTLPPSMVNRALQTNTLRLSGQNQDVSEIVSQCKREMADRIMNRVMAKVGDGQDLECILFVGGGSLVLADALKKCYSHGVIPDSPEFANARGMLKTVKFLQG